MRNFIISLVSILPFIGAMVFVILIMPPKMEDPDGYTRTGIFIYSLIFGSLASAAWAVILIHFFGKD